MRLLELELLNVNSLYGRWRIDFTNPEFQRNPLFAIIGPTGSGKSSLLDAIALALYGKTPRMDAMPRASEGDKDAQCPVMSKGETIVRAAVRFQVDGVTYMSSWQRRITSRAKRLTEPEVELVRFDNEHATEGEVLTTKLTDWRNRMVDITHMTFETFLRSVLLSQGAFAEFLKAKDDDRANILEQITGTAIYSEISRWIFLRAKEENQRMLGLQQQLASLTPLTDEVREQLNAQLSTLRSRVTALQAQQKVTLQALQWRENVDRLTKESDRVTTLRDKAQAALTALSADLERARAAEAALLPGMALANWRQHQVTWTRLLEDIKATEEALPTLHATTLVKAGEKTAKAEALAAAQKVLDDFEPLYQAVRSLDAALLTATSIHDVKVGQRTQWAERLAKENKALAASQKKWEKATELKAISEAQLAALGNVQQEGAMTPALVRTHWEAWQKAEAAVNALRTTAVQQEATLATAKGELAKAEETLIAARQALNTAEAQEAANDEALEVISASDTIRGKLDEWDRLAKRETNVTLVTRTDRAVAMVSALLSTAAPAQGLEASVSEVLTQELLADLTPEALTAARMPEALTQIAELKSAILAWRDEEETLKAKRKTLARATTAARKAVESAASAVQQKRLTLEKAEGEVRLTAQSLQQVEVQWRTEKPITTAALGLADETADLAAAEQSLTLYETQWANFEAATVALRKADEQLALIAVDVAAKRESVTTIEADLKTLDETLKAEVGELERLKKERVALFGDKDPDAEQKALRQAVSSATRAETLAEKAYQTAVQAHEKMLAQKDQLRSQSARQEATLKAAEEELRSRMAKAGIETIEALEARLMPEDEMRGILARGEKAQSALQDATSKLSLLTQQLSVLTTQAVTDKTQSQLIDEREAQESEMLASTRAVTQIEEQLTADAAVAEKTRTLQAECRRQTEVLADWQGLNQLIGSADGKKFRAIAQRITFRLLLREANTVMGTMTKRYSLHAAGSSGMAVDVVDHDMGSVVRTAANLSGGETFLVSLALALALSRMGGQYLNVDTLFLDEGFGTLDEEALNKAIYALETLQRRSGKLIGLISHVKMIKERVALQVTVQPVPGTGHSLLSGPGIRELAV